MATLVTPNVIFRSSWLEAAVEFGGPTGMVVEARIGLWKNSGIRWTLADSLTNLLLPHYPRAHGSLVMCRAPICGSLKGTWFLVPLPIAHDLEISHVLVTCDEDNAGSRGTIEKNGGVYEACRNGKRR